MSLVLCCCVQERNEGKKKKNLAKQHLVHRHSEENKGGGRGVRCEKEGGGRVGETSSRN